jgi:hypothetical protein
MENTILIVDFGSTFLKGLGFVPSKNGAKFLIFISEGIYLKNPKRLPKA